MVIKVKTHRTIITFAAMEKLRIGQRIELEISSYAFGGKGIAKITTDKGELVVFVQNALPGQRVLARVVKSKRKYAECKMVSVIQRAPEEVESPYQDISGAPYAHLPVLVQKELKRNSAFELYRRIGKIEEIEELYDEWIDAPDPWHYRNKMEYSFSSINSNPETGLESDSFSLGFKRRGSWWAVENLDGDSGLFDAEIENNLHLLRQYLEETGLAAWNPRKRIGFFKNLVVRKSFSQNKFLFNLITGPDEDKRFDQKDFVQKCIDLYGNRIEGIFHAVNASTGDRSSLDDGDFELIHGKPVITEELHGLSFAISIKSFFQPNPKCAELLYAKALDYVGDSIQTDNQSVLLDLFCGTGTISQLLKRRFANSRVLGVDIEPSAIEDAENNARRNGMENIEFHTGDVGRFLFEHPDLQQQIEVAVMDPPRAGIAPKTLRKVIRLEAKKLVYISCNPATQARDCEILAEAGYGLKKLSLVDQFPHTAHVEAVALFELSE